MNRNVNALFNRHYIRIGENYFYRALTAIYLFDFLDRLRESRFPQDWFIILARELQELIHSFDSFNLLFRFSGNKFNLWQRSGNNGTLESKTAKTYFNLFSSFRKGEFQEAFALLKERFKKNDISVKGIKSVLDAGCGSGRYTFALKKLGGIRVTGIDLSGDSIRFAQSKNPFRPREVNFVQGSVLKLPFSDDTFGFVFSNGVLHHTTDTFSGLKEICRVLRKRGCAWIYLYGGKRSLFWDIVDFCRKSLSGIPQGYMQYLMMVLGYPPGKIFHRADFLYVPINNRYYESEVEEMLREAGFKRFRRLKRGVAYDWDEIIFNNHKIDPYIYGEGEMRYFAGK